MKNYLAVIAAFSIFVHTYGQSNEFLGVASGGKYDSGIVYATDSVGNFKKIVHAFQSVKGTHPVGELALAADGSFYGVTGAGGDYNRGVLFQYFPSSNTYEVHFSFGETNTHGQSPGAGLLIASNGKIYGSTRDGGSNGAGTLFVYDIDKDSVSFFHSFSTSGGSGNDPQSRFTETQDGDLILPLYYGGSNNSGAIYEVDTATLTVTKLVDFDNTVNGRQPSGDLVEVSSNIFYGAALVGGKYNKGTLFEFDRNTGVLTTKLHFESNRTTGEYPYDGVMLASNGKLYGVADADIGNDILYEYDPSTGIFKNILTFQYLNGRTPRSKLVEVTAGVLVGTCYSNGGPLSDGTLYSYKIGEDTVTNLQSFDGNKNGKNPRFGVAVGADGKIYGVLTNGDGAMYNGSIYSYDLSKGEFARPLYFGYGVYGVQPSGTLIQADNGMLYGNCQLGGENNLGVIYSMDPNTYKIETLWNYVDSLGFNMQGGLTEASNGKLYGLCVYGGENNHGTLLEFDPATNKVEKLASFEKNATGFSSGYGVVEAIPGFLFGVRSLGGIYGNGTMFQYDIQNNTLTNVFDFEKDVSGSSPTGIPTLVDGKLYGLTYAGGTRNEGVLYTFDPKTKAYSVKISFSRNVTGKYPIGSLLLANNGLLYGSTTEGGGYSVGSLFEYYPNTNQLLNKASYFRGKTEERATGEHMQGSNGHLYGLTSKGGDNDNGVLYEYKIGTKLITRKYHLNRLETGWYVNGTLLEVNSCRFTRTIVDQPKISARAELVNYQWLNCDDNFSKIDGETNKDFRPKTDGNYAVEISSRFCKDTSDCVNLMPSSVDELTSFNVKIYPNPSDHVITIDLPTIGGTLELKIIDVTGKIVYQKLERTIGQSLLRHNLQSGIYFISIKTETGEFVEKLIVR